MQELLKEFKVITNVNVQWRDMDAMRHVNNVSYVIWGERARIDYFLAVDLFSKHPENDKYGPILGFQSVKYIVPLVFPDSVIIGTKATEIKEDRIVLTSYFYSKNRQKLAAVKTHEVIIYDYKTNRKVNVPKELIERIKNLEQF